MLAEYLHYLRSFYKRRIFIPARRDELVLDVGSGNLPHWRADVVCDRSLGADKNRSRAVSTAVVKSFLLCDFEFLPFRDKQFDWGISSHVFEHVDDPAKVLEEYMRCCKSGIVAVPREAFEKLHSWDVGHKWYVRIDEGTLVFTEKSGTVFDEEISRFVTEDLLPSRQWKSFYLQYAEKVETRLVWKDRFQYKVVRCGNESHKNRTEPLHGGFSASSGLGPAGMEEAYRLMRTLLRYAARLKAIDLWPLMVCPKCKGALGPALNCPVCQLKFSEKDGIYDLRVNK